MRSYKFFITSLAVLMFAVFGILFFQVNNNFENWLQDETIQLNQVSKNSIKINQLNFPTNYHNNDENTNDNQNNDKITATFFFRPLSKMWIRPNVKQFGQSANVSGEIPSNWIILNFLDYWYPNWNENFYITQDALKKSIKRKNYITFQLKPKAIAKKIRGSITMNDLKEINIYHSILKVSEIKIQEFLQYLNDSTKSREEITKIIENIFASSNIVSIEKKISAGIYFY